MSVNFYIMPIKCFFIIAKFKKFMNAVGEEEREQDERMAKIEGKTETHQLCTLRIIY